MTRERDRYRYVRIAIACALMASAVFVFGRSWRSATQPAELPLLGQGETPSISTETGVFELSRSALDYRRTADIASTRTMATFSSRRAYPGAPPYIPHPLADATSYGGQTCLACHADGGWVEKLKAFAPVTPHPDLINCMQCHVGDTGAALFRQSTFVRPAAPATGQAALPGSPPAIPHSLQLRDNCLACHAGPGAVRELRVTHPERSNCRQCHAIGAVPAPPFDRGRGDQR